MLFRSCTIVGLRFVQTELYRSFPRGAIYSIESPDNWWVWGLIYAATVTAIGIEIKVFNSVRIQIKLEEQERLLLHARMEALQNQINPHFLFNTLNSISSLVRFDPDTARDMIFKLATILRRLLNSSEAFASLREEFEFIDNYLDIEVEDDGVGIGKTQLENSGHWSGMGIGMANISERLQVLYGDTARMTIDSQEGKGTLVRIRLPLVEAASSIPEGFYAERSSTRR